MLHVLGVSRLDVLDASMLSVLQMVCVHACMRACACTHPTDLLRANAYRCMMVTVPVILLFGTLLTSSTSDTIAS